MIWSKELNRWRWGPRRADSGLFARTIVPGGEAYPPGGAPEPRRTRLWLEHEWVNPRPPKGAVRLPAGSYKAGIQLTEESFHIIRKNGWARVLQAPVSFEIVPDDE